MQRFLFPNDIQQCKLEMEDEIISSIFQKQIFFLLVGSTLLTMPREVFRKKVTKKTHFSHPEQELKLSNYQKPYRCDGCKEQGYGSRYRCELCNFDLHKECMFPSVTTFFICHVLDTISSSLLPLERESMKCLGLMCN